MFDWNQIEQSKSLGEAKIELADLEPFVSVERELPLTHAKHGEKGRVSLRLMFQPEIIVKSRKNTSTFSTAGRAMTQIGHIPGAAGKGVIHGVTGVFRRVGGSGTDTESEDERLAPLRSIPAAGQATQDTSIVGGALHPGTAFPATNGSPQQANGQLYAEPGTLRVTVLDAKDLSTNDVKPYVTIRVGDKEQKTKHIKSSTPTW